MDDETDAREERREPKGPETRRLPYLLSSILKLASREAARMPETHRGCSAAFHDLEERGDPARSGVACSLAGVLAVRLSNASLRTIVRGELGPEKEPAMAIARLCAGDFPAAWSAMRRYRYGLTGTSANADARMRTEWAATGNAVCLAAERMPVRPEHWYESRKGLQEYTEKVLEVLPVLEELELEVLDREGNLRPEYIPPEVRAVRNRGETVAELDDLVARLERFRDSMRRDALLVNLTGKQRTWAAAGLNVAHRSVRDVAKLVRRHEKRAEECAPEANP